MTKEQVSLDTLVERVNNLAKQVEKHDEVLDRPSWGVVKAMTILTGLAMTLVGVIAGYLMAAGG